MVIRTGLKIGFANTYGKDVSDVFQSFYDISH
jgi:hypothetical protein